MGWIRTGSIALALACSVFRGHALAQPSNQAEADTAWLINTVRESAGLPPLAPDADLERAARAQTGRMIRTGTLCHTERASLRALAASWARLAENVGLGASVERVYVSFLASAPHAANMLGDFTHVGIGARRDTSGRLFVTLIFAHAPTPGEPRAADPGAPPAPAQPHHLPD